MVNHTSPGLGHGLGLESDLQHLDLLIYLLSYLGLNYVR